MRITVSLCAAEVMDEDLEEALFGDADAFEEINDDFVLEAAKVRHKGGCAHACIYVTRGCYCLLQSFDVTACMG
jgi:hypothetical protein